MKTNEAIKFLEMFRPGKLLYAINEKAFQEYNLELKEIDDLIELFKRGEKFEQMWEEFHNKNKFVWVEKETEHCHQITLQRLMENFEQKYFPEPKKVIK